MVQPGVAPAAPSSKSATSTPSDARMPEEVVHVDVAALAFRAPLGHEGNRVDSAGARAGRNARAVAPEPGLDGEVAAPSPGAAPNVT